MKKNVLAVILAAGKGNRFTHDVPKQYIELRRKPILAYSLEAFEHVDDVDAICVVASEDCFPTVERIAKKYKITKLQYVIQGGEVRTDSVRSALDIASEYTNVLIHDSARPLVPQECVQQMIDTLNSGCLATTAALESTDTVAVSMDRQTVANIPQRSNIFMIQTPQGFRSSIIKDAYDRMKNDELSPAFTDDCGLVMNYFPDVDIQIVPGSRGLHKLTYPEDMSVLESILKS